VEYFVNMEKTDFDSDSSHARWGQINVENRRCLSVASIMTPIAMRRGEQGTDHIV